MFKLLRAALASAAACVSVIAAPINAPAAAAAPWVQLDAATFGPTVSQGAWLVEFVDAKHESEKFAPTWTELAASKQSLSTDYPTAPLSFAQVDCKAHIKLCVDQGITATPRLLTYRDGTKPAAQFIGSRDYATLAAWVDAQAAEYRKAKGVPDVQSATSDTLSSPPDATPPPASQATKGSSSQSALASALAQQPAAQSSAVPASSKTSAPLGPAGPNPEGVLMHFGEAPIKDDEALAEWLSVGGGNGPSFVKFMAPWCPHCQHMGPAFLKASSTLKGQVNAIEVNCDKYHMTCRQYRINSFPTLRLYKNGEATEYTGSRSHDAMVNWALKAGGSALRPITADDLPTLAPQHDVFFLYLYSPGTSDEERARVSNATSVLLGKETFAFESSDPALLDKYSSYLHPGRGSQVARRSLSGLLVFKEHSTKRPHDKMNLAALSTVNADAVAVITTWVHQQRFPNVIELMSTNFADVMFNDAGVKVVVAAVSDVHHGGNVVETGSGSREREYELTIFRKLASDWRSQSRAEQILFAWIDADRWATAVKSYFNVHGIDLPRLLFVDGAKMQYYELPSDSAAAAHAHPWLSSGAVFDRLAAVHAGHVKPKSMQTYIDRSMHAASSLIVIFVGYYFAHPFIGTILLIALIIVTVRVIKLTKRGHHGRHGSRRLTSHSSLPVTNVPVPVPGKTKSG